MEQHPPVAQPQYMHFERALATSPGPAQACMLLDAAVFAHAAASLADLRVFSGEQGAHEVPYVVTMSQTATEETLPAKLLNLGWSGSGENRAIAFDLEMPAGAYSDVRLQIDPAIRDFIATATVIGLEKAVGVRTALGSYTVFDLTSQQLSRDTTLPLPESTFPLLHVVLSVSPAPHSPANGARQFDPAMVLGADVPPSREAQVLYTPVAETTKVTDQARRSVARFDVPARIPVERVLFALPADFKGNFSRTVQITAKAQAAPGSRLGSDQGQPAPASQPETLTGEISRIHTNEAGHEIVREQLAVPAVLGANLQRSEAVEVAIEDGDDRPLPLQSVRLEMRQRKLCFDASEQPAGVKLFYGDATLVAPMYDYQRLYDPAAKTENVTLGPELANPQYHPRAVAERPFTERHPEVLWIALIAVVCALGMVALRSSRRVA